MHRSCEKFDNYEPLYFNYPCASPPPQSWHQQQRAHHDVMCDACSQFPIVGDRYHCNQCRPDFDLCQQCFINRLHDLSHAFTVVPSQNCEHSFQNRGDNVHQGVICDCCKHTPIPGSRYTCTDCPGYDLCGQCYNRTHGQFHNPSHRFVEIPSPCSPPASSIEQPEILKSTEERILDDVLQKGELVFVSEVPSAIAERYRQEYLDQVARPMATELAPLWLAFKMETDPNKMDFIQKQIDQLEQKYFEDIWENHVCPQVQYQLNHFGPPPHINNTAIHTALTILRTQEMNEAMQAAGMIPNSMNAMM
jgi:hypothetical protein